MVSVTDAMLEAASLVAVSLPTTEGAFAIDGDSSSAACSSTCDAPGTSAPGPDISDYTRTEQCRTSLSSSPTAAVSVTVTTEETCSDVHHTIEGAGGPGTASARRRDCMALLLLRYAMPGSGAGVHSTAVCVWVAPL